MSAVPASRYLFGTLPLYSVLIVLGAFIAVLLALHEEKVAGIVKREGKKVYPNDPCPCGSGKKYKKCCGKANNA